MKKMIAVLALFLMMGAGTGLIYAYLTDKEEVTNELSAADTKIGITEDFTPPKELQPGMVIPKKVRVRSDSDRDVYVRVRLYFSCLEAETFCGDLCMGSGWTKGDDDFWYWQEKLQPGRETGDLIEEIRIRRDVPQEDLMPFDIQVYAEAVACGSGEMMERWE